MILANHVDSQAAKARASKPGLGRVKHVVVRCMFPQDVANKKHATLAHVNTKSNKCRFDDDASWAQRQQSVFSVLGIISVCSYSFGAERITFLCSYSFGAGENQFVKQFQFSTGKAFF